MKCSLRRNNVTFAEFELSAGEQTLGSANDNTIKVRSSAVSNHHARLFEQDGRAYVEDVGSTNGTVVNGEELVGEKELRDGDIILLGDISFKFHGSGVERRGAAPVGAAKAAAPAGAAAERKRRKTGGSSAAGRGLDILLSAWKVAVLVAIVGLVALWVKKRAAQEPKEDVETRQPAAATAQPEPKPAPAGNDQWTATGGGDDTAAGTTTGFGGGNQQTGGFGARQPAGGGFGDTGAGFGTTTPGFGTGTRPEELEKLAKTYQDRVAAIEQEYADTIEKLFTEYGAYLEKLKQEVMSRGDLEGTLSVKEEKEAFDAAPDKGQYFQQQYYARPNSPPNLTRARQYCTGQMGKAHTIKEGKLKNEQAGYAQSLLDLQKRLTMSGDLDGALAVKAEREQLR
ncbi:MAG: FHA domain-containing protein [Kiritimatiellae bacterium]|nr:FHA domain-containing protein [Kiritimatiellia bacterium]